MSGPHEVPEIALDDSAAELEESEIESEESESILEDSGSEDSESEDSGSEDSHLEESEDGSEEDEPEESTNEEQKSTDKPEKSENKPEEPVESEETRMSMARLHSLLTRKKGPSAPSLPLRKKIPLRPQIPHRDVNNLITIHSALDNNAPYASSRTDRTPKPPPHLRLKEWRTAALLQYHSKLVSSKPHPTEANVPNPPPSFLFLPPELRTVVYFELLVTNDRLLSTWRGPRPATKQQKKIHINILLTCKACRDEGLQVLYGENIFDFGEICYQPHISTQFVGRIGLYNASLIRIVFAEYAAGLEDLIGRDANADAEITPTNFSTRSLLSVPYLRGFLSTFNITLPHLRLLAISILPYGNNAATNDLLSRGYMFERTRRQRREWFAWRNEPTRFGKLVDGICAREKGLARADYWRDIDGWIGFSFAPPSLGREWVVYRGVRGREDALRRAEERQDGEAKIERDTSDADADLGAGESVLVLRPSQ